MGESKADALVVAILSSSSSLESFSARENEWFWIYDQLLASLEEETILDFSCEDRIMWHSLIGLFWIMKFQTSNLC